MAKPTLFVSLPSVLMLPTTDALSAAAREISIVAMLGGKADGVLDVVQRHAVQLARSEESIATALRGMQDRYVYRPVLTDNSDYCRALSFLLAIEELGNYLDDPSLRAIPAAVRAESVYWRRIEEHTKLWPQAVQLIAWVWSRNSFVQPVADPVMRLTGPGARPHGAKNPLLSTIYRHDYASSCLGRFARLALVENEGMMSPEFWRHYHGLLANAAFVGMTDYDMRAAKAVGIPHRIYFRHDVTGLMPAEATHRVVSLNDIPKYLQQHGW